MDPFQVGALAEVLTTLIIAGTLVTGLGLFLHHRRKGVSGGSTEHLAELTRAVDSLRVSVEGMRQDLTEVNERLDFTERLLAQQASKPRGQLGPS